MNEIFFILDAFTSPSFKGNPAAVVLLDQPKSDEWLQTTAAEFNLSETAFLWALDRPDHKLATHFHLRWLTPTCEVKLCGHATLASVQVLNKELGNPAQQFKFSTLSGELIANLAGENYELAFPISEPKRLSNIFVDDAKNGIESLGLKPVTAFQAKDYILLELESESAVASYHPDFNLIAQVDTHAIILTALSSDPAIDFVSRFFAPRLGVNEDPVTGSAHCALAPLWAAKLSKPFLRAKQLSQRGGYLELQLKGEQVKLIGQCKTFAKGSLCNA